MIDREVVRFVNVATYSSQNGDVLRVDFGARLQTSGSDIRVYTNNGVPTDQHNFTALLVKILEELMGNLNSGVDNVTCKLYTLHICVSRAVEVGFVIDLIKKGILNAGMEPEDHTPTD